MVPAKSQKQSETMCAHPGCECPVEQGARERAGKRYCSEGCESGDGCTHEGCGCGES